VALIVGVAGTGALSRGESTAVIRARPSSGSPRPTTNHCTALDFLGVVAPDDL